MEILVGPEYKDAFQQVLILASAGVIKGVSVDAAGTRISSENKTFVCPSINEGRTTEATSTQRTSTTSAINATNTADTNSARLFKFIESGASWFKRLRGGDIAEDDVSVWLSFIDKVATQYHQTYSLLEFKQKSADLNSQEKIEKEKALIKRVFTYLYPKYNNADVRKGDEKDRIQDVYCVSFRMLVHNSGEAKPILAKVYFRNEDNTMKPLNKAEAIGVNEHLCSQGAVQTEEGADAGATFENSNEIIENALGALDTLAAGQQYNFTDYIIYSDKKDEEAVSKLIDNSNVEDVELTCKSVKVLYIAHVKWSSTAYNIFYEGEMLMKVKLGLNFGVTMICDKCKSIIVSSNTITSRLDNKEVKVTINPTDPKQDYSFGLDEKDLQILRKIIEKGEISGHLRYLECEKGYGRGKCSRIVCSEHLEKIVVGGENKELCKDCPFPEVIYEISGGRRRHISTLRFARDKMDLEEAAELQACACCGRMFTNITADKELCQFCQTAKLLAAGGGDRSQAGKLYKKYANMLPLNKRMRHLFDKKYCIEDVDIILFILGSDIYIFDKLQIDDHGFISSPIHAKVEG